MTLFEIATPTRWGYRDVDPGRVYDTRDHLIVVDVRDPEEFALGHIPGALLVPLQVVGTALRAWSPLDEIVLVCRSGRRSADAAEALVSAGFHRVMNLAGGMLSYEAAGLPIERALVADLQRNRA